MAIWKSTFFCAKMIEDIGLQHDAGLEYMQAGFSICRAGLALQIRSFVAQSSVKIEKRRAKNTAGKLKSTVLVDFGLWQTTWVQFAESRISTTIA